MSCSLTSNSSMAREIWRDKVIIATCISDDRLDMQISIKLELSFVEILFSKHP